MNNELSSRFILENNGREQSFAPATTYLITALTAFRRKCHHRLGQLADTVSSFEFPSIPEPDETDTTPLANFVRTHRLSDDECTVLLTALVPHILPGFFDEAVQEVYQQGAVLPVFGGVKGEQHRGLLPTGETALFLLAGKDPVERMRYMPMFNDNSFLFSSGILSLEVTRKKEPTLSNRLTIDAEFVEVFTTGKVALPKLSIHFPAQHIDTDLEWDDLVLAPNTFERIQEIQNWILYREPLMESWGMKKRVKPGYRVMFHGPPGTGKTLTATLLGKYTDRPVFRIDLSTIVSKYIGETEKNLASLFTKAEHKQWILFFDEADAIFGKRTGVRDAHDKYANQEVSYLLQRIEAHSGLIILASNFKNNIDHAFVRRFNAIVYFPVPSEAERFELWKRAFPSAAPLASDVDFMNLAKAHKLTGSQITNIVQHTCLEALANQPDIHIDQQRIEEAIRREFAKEGK